MDVIIFMAFLFFSLISLGYAFYNKKVIYLAIISSLVIIVLAAALMTEGITQMFAGSYGFFNNTSNSTATGMSAIKVTILENTNVFAQGSGAFLVVLGLMTLFLTFYFMLKGSEEEEE